jgi:hypothetical protein
MNIDDVVMWVNPSNPLYTEYCPIIGIIDDHIVLLQNSSGNEFQAYVQDVRESIP